MVWNNTQWLEILQLYKVTGNINSQVDSSLVAQLEDFKTSQENLMQKTRYNT